VVRTSDAEQEVLAEAQAASPAAAAAAADG